MGKGILKGRDMAAAAIKRYAHVTADLNLATAARDQAMTAVREQHQPKIDRLSTELKDLEQQLQVWGEENRKEFGEAQSLEFSHGWLKFRTGARRIVCLARWTEEKVLQALLDFPPTSQWREFLRVKHEVNKRKLLDETGTGKFPEVRLREIGLRVERGESFSIETKPEMVARDCDVMP